MPLYNYSNTAAATTITSSINSSTTGPVTIAAASGLPAVPFKMVLEPGTANQEIIVVGARTGTSLSSITRGADGSTGVSHSSGAVIAHEVTAEDIQKANWNPTLVTTSGSFASATSGTLVNTSVPVPTDCRLVEMVMSLYYLGPNEPIITITLGGTAMNGSGRRWGTRSSGTTMNSTNTTWLASPTAGSQTLVVSFSSMATASAVTGEFLLKFYT